MEQAEQQFTAAGSIGYDSRALNLYYGLSQAGRAVAAAAKVLGHGEWTLTGHGLKCRGLQNVNEEISKLVVKPEGNVATGFQRLSQILRSPLPPELELEVLWPLVHEVALGRIAPMRVAVRNKVTVGAVVATVTLPPAIVATPLGERPSLSDFLHHYPALEGWESVTGADSHSTWPHPDHRSLDLVWASDPADLRLAEAITDRLTLYRGTTMAYPVLADMREPLHPLMVWWIFLYCFSMLTRYQPARWTSLIDVDSSRDAIAIELLLDKALAVVPTLVDEALDLVA